MTVDQSLEVLARHLDGTEDDTEQAHRSADAALCEVLQALGYDRLVAAWQEVGKWYA